MKANSLKHELQQFMGSEVLYTHGTGLIKYTEGTRFLAEEARAYWLIDIVASYQTHKQFKLKIFRYMI